jgi:TPR repeat protein
MKLPRLPSLFRKAENGDGLAGPALAARAKAGDPQAQTDYGIALADGAAGGPPDLAKAERWWLLAAQKGGIEAQYRLGCLALLPGKFDPLTASGWFEKAAAAGHVFAMVELAALYERGEGLARDLERARLLYESAASSGDLLARLKLGLLHERGGDRSQALVWYRAAASMEHPGACYRLGQMLTADPAETGDLAEAAGWYRTAALRGHAQAQACLGLLYCDGRGVAQDDVLAHAWLGLAVAGLSDEEWRNAVECAQRDVAERLSAQDRRAAEALLRTWRDFGSEVGSEIGGSGDAAAPRAPESVVGGGASALR